MASYCRGDDAMVGVGWDPHSDAGVRYLAAWEYMAEEEPVPVWGGQRCANTWLAWVANGDGYNPVGFIRWYLDLP